jgi:hydrogenase nickel incorporation protein HypA/HybF
MHELSIAMSIVEMAEEESARRDNAKIHSIHLRLGLLSGVVKEALLSSYEMACLSTPLEGSQLIIEEVPVEVFCPACKARVAIPSIQWMACPHCGTPAPDIQQGKELEIFAMEIETPETHAPLGDTSPGKEPERNQ